MTGHLKRNFSINIQEKETLTNSGKLKNNKLYTIICWHHTFLTPPAMKLTLKGEW